VRLFITVLEAKRLNLLIYAKLTVRIGSECEQIIQVVQYSRAATQCMYHGDVHVITKLLWFREVFEIPKT
jgi:hypothetical protein